MNFDWILLPHSLSWEPEAVMVEGKANIDAYIKYRQVRLDEMLDAFPSSSSPLINHYMILPLDTMHTKRTSVCSCKSCKIKFMSKGKDLNDSTGGEKCVTKTRKEL